MTGFSYFFIALAVLWSTVHAKTLISDSRDDRVYRHLSLAEFLSNGRKSSKDVKVTTRTASQDVLTCNECVMSGPRDTCLFKQKECGPGMLCGAFVFETGSFNGCVDPGMCSLLQSDTGVSGRCCSENNCNM